MEIRVWRRGLSQVGGRGVEQESLSSVLGEERNDEEAAMNRR